MKRIIWLVSVAALGLLLGAVPAVAAKRLLSDAELELITAAGQPEVLVGTTISLTENQDFQFSAAGNAQAGLRALALNNVLGENLLANTFNIQATPGSTGGGQANTIEQSWGSTYGLPEPPASPASIDISGTCVACTNIVGPGGGTISISGKAVGTTNIVGGAGGGGGTPGIYADKIVLGSAITMNVQNQYSLALSGNAQSGLSALVVNNVVGLNLVANGINISSGSVQLAGDPFLSAASAQAMGQTNTINQARGTPLKKP